MRRHLAVGLLGLCTAAALGVGCDDGELDADCVEQLVWRGSDYAGHPHRPVLLQLHPARPQPERVWALRSNETPADAVYVALAERLRLALLTCDRTLARAAARHTALDIVAPARRARPGFPDR